MSFVVRSQTARSSGNWVRIRPSLELRAELELDAARSAGAGRAGVQDSGNPTETRRRLDREVGSAAAHRADARTGGLVFRVVQQVEGRRAEVQGHTFGNVEALLQGRVDLISARASRDVAAQVSPGEIGGRRKRC